MPGSFSKRRIRLVVLLDAYTVSGSARVVIQNIINQSESIDATVVLFRRSGRAENELERFFSDHAVKFIVIPERIPFDPLVLLKVIRTVRNLAAEIIESNHYKTHLLALLSSKVTGVPWVAVSHGWTSENIRIRLYNMLDRVSLPFCTASVAMGPTIAARLKKILPHSIRPRLLPTALDPALMTDVSVTSGNSFRNSYGIRSEEFVFGAIGRLSFEKGFDILIRAAGILKEAGRPFRIMLAGSGSELSVLRELSYSLGLEKHIVFAGQIPSDQILNIYNTLDCLVIPSRSEGMPNVILESAYYRLPVISADVGGIPDLMNAALAKWIFSAGDFHQLAVLMSKMSSLNLVERKDLGEQLRHRVLNDYNAKKRSARVVRLYRSILRKKVFKSR